MGYFIGKVVVIETQTSSKKASKKKTSFPPEIENADKYFGHMSIEDVEKISSKEMRHYLRVNARKPVKNQQGLPFAYRVYFMGGDKMIKTFFPKTKRGEKMVEHGRLDYEEYTLAMLRARQQPSNHQED